MNKCLNLKTVVSFYENEIKKLYKNHNFSINHVSGYSFYNVGGVLKG